MSTAAPAAAIESGAATPWARLSTKGSMSVMPTMAASTSMPVSPKRLFTQLEATEMTTKSTAKSAAALSSSGLRCASCSGASSRGGAPVLPEGEQQADQRKREERRREAQRELRIEDADHHQHARIHQRRGEDDP